MLLSTKHENDDIGNKAISTLSRLIQSSQQEILMKCAQLITQIGEKMKIDMARFMELFTQKTPEKASVSLWSSFDNNAYPKTLTEINNKLSFHPYVIHMYNLYACNEINPVKASYEKYLLL